MSEVAAAMRNSDVTVLRNAGILHPRRAVRKIEEAVRSLKLDLSDLTVLTEAASGIYAVTPVIAAMAGAEKVLAITGESSYGKVDHVAAQTGALERLADVGGKISIHTCRDLALFSRADIVTNLGFVRPIDRDAVGAMKSTAAVPLMCESWEFREGDVDLPSCRRKGVVVMGTDEGCRTTDIFDYCGWLSIKMLLDAQIEIHRSTIAVAGGDKFGKVIASLLKRAGVAVSLGGTVGEISREVLREADALIVADYRRKDVIIGPGGDMTVSDLVGIAPTLTVIQFAGSIDVQSLEERGIVVYPGGRDSGAVRMARTLADIGPRPVIELHAAGLKVGESIARARRDKKMTPREAVEHALEHSPAQEVPF